MDEIKRLTKVGVHYQTHMDYYRIYAVINEFLMRPSQEIWMTISRLLKVNKSVLEKAVWNDSVTFDIELVKYSQSLRKLLKKHKAQESLPPVGTISAGEQMVCVDRQ